MVSCPTVTKPTDITLRQYAKDNPGRSTQGTQVERDLPAEIIDQLISEAKSTALDRVGAAVIERWLHDLGHTSVNRSQIDYFLCKHRPPSVSVDG